MWVWLRFCSTTVWVLNRVDLVFFFFFFLIWFLFWWDFGGQWWRRDGSDWQWRHGVRG